MFALLVPVYRDSKSLDTFLYNLTKQTQDDFNLYLIIDTNNGQTLEVVEKYKKTIKNINLIFNTKRTGKLNSIKNAIKHVEEDYIYTTSTTSIFGKTFVDEMNKLIVKGKSDIIEFNVQIRKPFRFKGEVRKEVKKTSIKDNKWIIAYSHPFDFNKIIKRSVYEKMYNQKIKSTVNSMFAIEHVYKLLMNAETYSSFNINLVSKNTKSSPAKTNPIELIEQWEIVKKYFDYNFGEEFKSELRFAMYFYIAVFVSAINKDIKSSTITTKVNKMITNIYKEDFSDFFDSNPYIITETEEKRILVKNKAIERNYRNIRDMSPWF